MKKYFPKGFTLIELLIVIAIIGILAVALLPSILGAPSRARDAARKADLNGIVAVLEAYNNDKQHYPEDVNKCVSDIKDGTPDVVLNNYFKGGTPPNDPQKKGVPGSGCAGGYVYSAGNGQVNYVLGSFMEQVGDMNTKTGWPNGQFDQNNKPVITPGKDDNTYYAVIN